MATKKTNSSTQKGAAALGKKMNITMPMKNSGKHMGLKMKKTMKSKRA